MSFQTRNLKDVCHINWSPYVMKLKKKHLQDIISAENFSDDMSAIDKAKIDIIRQKICS